MGGQGKRELRDSERNHVIAAGEDVAPGGTKTRIKANLRAVKLLRAGKADRSPASGGLLTKVNFGALHR